jgi:bifunctional enzyme CysN/CysC
MDAFEKAAPKSGQPFRMPIQDVYKFTSMGDDRRIVSGRIDSGTLKAGDEVIFHPSGKRSRVAAIEGFNRKAMQSVEAGASTGVTLTTQVYVGRGEIMARADEPAPCVGTRIRVDVFWMGRQPLTPGKDYFLKLGTAKVPMRLEKIEFLIDASETQGVSEKNAVERHDVADCIFALRKTIAFDPIDLLESTGRFVIVDGYEIAGGGIIREALPEIDDSAEADAAAWKSLALGPVTESGGILVLVGSDDALSKKSLELEQHLRSVGKSGLLIGLPDDSKDDASLGQSRRGMPRPEALSRLTALAWFHARSGAWALLRLSEADVEDLLVLETFAADTRLALVAPSDLLASSRWKRLARPDWQELSSAFGIF